MILIPRKIRALAPSHLAQRAGHGTQVLLSKDKALSAPPTAFTERCTDFFFFIFMLSTFSLAISSNIHLRLSPDQGQEKVTDTLAGLVKHSEKGLESRVNESLT